MKFFLKIIPFSLVISGCSTYMENKKAEDFVPIHQEISFDEKNDTINGSIYDEKSSGFLLVIEEQIMLETYLQSL